MGNFTFEEMNLMCEKRPELTKENQYLIRFANGECRTFTRSILELDGEEIVEITSADTTDLYGLLCEQELELQLETLRMKLKIQQILLRKADVLMELRKQ